MIISVSRINRIIKITVRTEKAGIVMPPHDQTMICLLRHGSEFVFTGYHGWPIWGSNPPCMGCVRYSATTWGTKRRYCFCCSSIAIARSLSGTLWARPCLVRSALNVHSFFSRSISSHRIPRTSPVLAHVHKCHCTPSKPGSWVHNTGPRCKLAC